MKAGKLRHPIIFQRQTGTTQDSFGAEEPVWAPLKVQPCKVTPLRGREFFAAAQVNAEVSHLIECRYFAGLAPKDRGLWGTRVFNLTAVINVNEADREYNIYASEVL